MERSKRRPDKGLWGPNQADSTEGQATSPNVDPFGPQRAAVSSKGSGGISGVSNSRLWKMPGRSSPGIKEAGLWGEMRIRRPAAPCQHRLTTPRAPAAREHEAAEAALDAAARPPWVSVQKRNPDNQRPGGGAGWTARKSSPSGWLDWADEKGGRNAGLRPRPSVWDRARGTEGYVHAAEPRKACGVQQRREQPARASAADERATVSGQASRWCPQL